MSARQTHLESRQRPGSETGGRALPFVLRTLAAMVLVAGLCLSTGVREASAQNCTDYSVSDCDVDGAGKCECTDVGALIAHGVNLRAGDRIAARVFDLQGQATDPKLYVAHVDGSPTQTIVAFSDDVGTGPGQEPFGSQVSFTAQSSGIHRFYVVNEPGRGGSAKLEIERNGSTYSIQQVVFATGAHDVQWRAGDALLVTKSDKDPTGLANPAYANPVVLAVPNDLSSDCSIDVDPGCGELEYNAMSLATLGRIDLTTNSRRGRVYVGTFNQTEEMHTRLYHLEYDLQNLDKIDWDGDGLPWDLERALGTCDAHPAPPPGSLNDERIQVRGDGSERCHEYAAFINAASSCDPCATTADCSNGEFCNRHKQCAWTDERFTSSCWSPMDSDHDGLTDFEEIFGLRRCYDQAPEPIVGDVGECLDSDADGYCDHQCTGAYHVELPLSAMDAVDPNDEWRPVSPNHYDLLVDAMHTATYDEATEQPGPADYTRRLPNGILRQLHYSIEEEPNECPNCAPSGESAYRKADEPVCDPAGETCCDDPTDGCPNAPRYRPRLHWYETAFVTPYDDTDEQGAFYTDHADYAAARFHHVQDPQRRYSGVFRLAMLGNATGFGTAPFGRYAGIGTEGWNAGFVILHEYGHTFGLLHGGDDPALARLPYGSLMSGSYSYTQPVKTPGWDGELQPCDTVLDCPSSVHFRCAGALDFDGDGVVDRRCLPQPSQARTVTDWNATNVRDFVVPWRYSRGLNKPAHLEHEEIDGIYEADNSQAMAFMMLAPQQSDDSLSATNQANYLAHVTRRAVRADGTRKIFCVGDECDIDFDENGYIYPTSDVDINGNGDVDTYLQTDWDDWAQILRHGKAALWSVHTGNNQLVYANHFLPDWSEWQPNGSGMLWCPPSSCLQTISFADNLAGFQPDYLSIGSGVSIEGRSSNGWWAKFDGTSSASVRFVDTRFRALTDDLRQFAKWAWEVELWFEADLPDDPSSTLFSSPALDIAIDGDPYLLSIHVTVPGVGRCVLPVQFRRNEHRGLRVTVDQRAGRINWWVGAPVPAGDPREISVTTGTYGTCSLASNGSSTTEFTLGGGIAGNFAGYIDAIAVRRRNLGQ